MIKNIVFDIGNVLVGFDYREYVDRFDFSEEVKERVIKATVQGPFWNEIDRGVWSCDEILDKFISVDPGIEEPLRRFYDNFEGLLTQFGYSKGMILDLKRKGFKVFCLSNMSYKAVNECGAALDFLPLLDGYVLSCDVKQIKPQLEIYETFLGKYKLKAEECVFLDDLSANIDAAKAVGMQGIQFTDLKTAIKELEKLVSETNKNSGSSYSKGQRTAAMVTAVLIAIMFLATLVFALLPGELFKTLFRVFLGCTVGLPILAWIYIWLIGKLTHKDTIADFKFFEEHE